MISVSEVMTKVVSIDSSMTIKDASKKMTDSKTDSMIVIEDGLPIGIITERDFAMCFAKSSFSIDEPIKEIMSSPLFKISSKRSLKEVADYMFEKNVRKIPVIYDDKVVGMITSKDLVKQFTKCSDEDRKKSYYHSIARIFERYQIYD